MGCENRHDWNFDAVPPVCARCGEPYPMSDIERYRYERLRRGLSLQKYRGDGKRKRSTGHGTCLKCPNCGSDIVVFGMAPRHGAKTRAVSCGDCLYRWNTASKEAFGGTRQVEVRG